MKERDEYYARIKKITGDKLFDKKIGIYNAPFVSKAVELLASCGVLNFTFDSPDLTDDFSANTWGICAGINFNDFLIYELMNHNQFEDRWQFNKGVMTGDEQLILAGGSFAECQSACAEANRKNIPAVIGVMFANGTSALSVVWPGQEFSLLAFQQSFVNADEPRYFDWIDLNNQMANIAKAILLEGTSWQRNDIMSLLKSGKNTILLSHPQWPWPSRWIDLSKESERQWLNDIVSSSENRAHNESNVQGKTVLIVGLGSLGSIAADHFRALGCNIIGIDGKDVSIHNPVRQIYSTGDIGKDKAFALARTLAQADGYGGNSATEQYISDVGPNSKSFCVEIVNANGKFIGLKMDIPDSRSGAESFGRIIEKYSPNLVVLATAHPAEYRMAEICRQKDIPHIIGRCYNRARWFEITVVDGNKGPCFGCLQGHLYKGVPATLTEEQLTRYDMAGDEANVVQAEPATRIDTARCADIIARFGLQSLQLYAGRAPWFLRMLNEERTCLIGGNYAEFHSETGEWSFGVSAPGGVALYGVINFIGSETEETKICLYCGKTHEVLIKRREFVQ